VPASSTAGSIGRSVDAMVSSCVLIAWSSRRVVSSVARSSATRCSASRIILVAWLSAVSTMSAARTGILLGPSGSSPYFLLSTLSGRPRLCRQLVRGILSLLQEFAHLFAEVQVTRIRLLL